MKISKLKIIKRVLFALFLIPLLITVSILLFDASFLNTLSTLLTHHDKWWDNWAFILFICNNLLCLISLLAYLGFAIILIIQAFKQGSFVIKGLMTEANCKVANKKGQVIALVISSLSFVPFIYFALVLVGVNLY